LPMILALTTCIVADARAAQDPETWIELHVQDAVGRPIQNFEYVRKGGALTSLTRGPDGSLPRFQKISDPEGSVRLRVYPNYYKGVWKDTFIVGAPGYVTNFHVIEPEDLKETTVHLEKGCVVSWRIADSAGNPVDGA